MKYEYTTAEIAVALNISENQVKKSFFAGMKKLESIFAKMGLAWD